jgi:hypothetical protein
MILFHRNFVKLSIKISKNYLPREPPLERDAPPPLLPDDLLGALLPDELDLLGAL